MVVVMVTSPRGVLQGRTETPVTTGGDLKNVHGLYGMPSGHSSFRLTTGEKG